MEDVEKIKDADEIINILDRSREELKELFIEHFGKESFDDLGKDTFRCLSNYMEMQVLSQSTDRKLALETFHKMDEERRSGIIDSLQETAWKVTVELSKRDRGIESKPGCYYSNMSTERMKKWLDNLIRFADELGISVSE